MDKRIVRSDTCLNCGTLLGPSVNYCPRCGQLNNTRKESATGLLKELITDFLHFDNKVFGSLLPLIFKPGFLSEEYNKGRRARYLHPVRLFISLTIIMLIVTSIGSNSNNKIVNTDGKIEIADSSSLTIGFSEQDIPYRRLKALMHSGITGEKELLDTLKLEDTYYNRFVMRKAIRLGEMSWHEVIEYVKHKIPWILFALMPVFALVLRLIYIRKKIWYVDHLIFSFHLHSATFIIITLNSMLGWISDYLSSWLILYIPVYFFIALHRVYKQSWGKTIFKGIVTGILYAGVGLAFTGLAMGLLFILI